MIFSFGNFSSGSSVLLKKMLFEPLLDPSRDKGETGMAQPCSLKLLRIASFLRDRGGGDTAFIRIAKRGGGRMVIDDPVLVSTKVADINPLGLGLLEAF